MITSKFLQYIEAIDTTSSSNMKQSNITTPRTLAECQFLTGYRSANLRPRREWPSVVITIVAMAAIGVMLAWRG